ncbi:MAG: FAD-dependent monooxygenase [Clostridia bacterium]|nr:FAD-dependent monooxygenase [Clostridia bacterium]
MTHRLVVNNIKLPINASVMEAFSVARGRLRRVGIDLPLEAFSVFRKSTDARSRESICFVYSISAEVEGVSIDSERLLAEGISLVQKRVPEIVFGTERPRSRILVVGSGPCGMFSALLLAECGFKPIVIERGGSIAERKRAVERFERERVLDASSNIQFGAGGAGTFSDGKLVTRINDPLSEYVLEALVRFGAPKEILYQAKPHVGTDILSGVVERILARIVELGGEVRYNTALLDFITNADGTYTARTTKGDITCSDIVLAIGHSARDTYEALIKKGMSVEAKSFSVGMRIEHLAHDIDRSMYGDNAGNPLLGHAEYNLSYNTKLRGAYTFCMCPGGVVVAAASEEGGVVCNGMSYHSRDGRNSNCAVLSSVFKEDYGGTPLEAIEFQRRIERAAFMQGGGNYSAPIMTVGDFLSGRRGSEPTTVKPTYMSGEGVTLSSFDEIYPDFVLDNIKGAILNFDKKIHGFASDSAILTAAETRTSSPLRILRSREDATAVGYGGIYPAGEGAGYAGGITSAAVDGIKTAMAIMKKYKPY